MNEYLKERSLEERLKELAGEAQKYSSDHPLRRLALNRLVNEILHNPRLGSPQKEAWSPLVYQDLFNEALQKTLLEVCRKIDRYQSERGEVMQWVNFYLDVNFKSVVKDLRNQGITNIPASKKGQLSCILSLDDLDHHLVTEESFAEEERLRQFIREDPENLMQEHIKGRSDITFQRIALAQIIKDKKWAEMAASWEVPTSTVSTFFYRQFKRLKPYFRKHLED